MKVQHILIWELILYNFKAMLQTIEANQTSLTSQSSVVHYIMTSAKASEKAKLCLTLPKYCKTFNST